jgi:hypothetical protein
MNVDKLTIVCSGNVAEAFNETNGRFFDYLWDNEFECTWSCVENQDSKNMIATVFGFEPVNGMVQDFLDANRKDNAVKALNDLGVDVKSIVHSVIDSKEFDKKKRTIKGLVEACE